MNFTYIKANTLKLIHFSNAIHQITRRTCRGDHSKNFLCPSAALNILYSTGQRKPTRSNKQDSPLRNVMVKNREKLLSAEQKLREKGENMVKDIRTQTINAEHRIKQKKDLILKDIIDTKSKVKEKLEQVIERENIYTVPNLLCVARITMSPFLGYMIVYENYNVALGMLVFAGVTDLLDGWIARKWSSQSSKMGSFLDPMADKILIATLFLTLTYQNLIPVPLTCLIIARDVILVIAGFVIRYKSLDPPRSLSRYFDASLVTVQLVPTTISKTNTAIQLLLVASTLAAPVFNYVDHPSLHILWYITGASTVAAGISYLVARNTYKFIKK